MLRNSILGFIFTLCLCSVFSNANAQAFKKRDIRKLEAHAIDFFDNRQFAEAIPLFAKLDSIKPFYPPYLFPLLVSCIGANKYIKALGVAEHALDIESEMPVDFYLYAAKAHHLNYKFDEAKSLYQAYRNSLSKKKKVDEELLRIVDRDILMCDNAKELVGNPLDIEIKSVGSNINSPYADYGPVLSADESMLIFTSDRPRQTGGFLNDAFENMEHIYVSHKTDSGWGAPEHMGDNINSNGHNAAVALSADGQKLLIYRSENNRILSLSSGDLYMSELEGDEWTKPVKLPEGINSKDWEPSASFSADERTLYFTSDRKGGYGGTDIYYVKKLPNGEWAVPRNLGDKINTPFNEDSPFMHPDGKTLYFSSNGHKSMGGFDIFYSELDEETGEWSTPVNVGYPINTPHDDVYFSWSADGTTAYFSSYRENSEGDIDIYYANVYNETSPVLLMKGLVVDSVSQKPIQATITVTDKNSDEVIGVFNSNRASGKFVIILNKGSYNVSIEAEEYEFCNRLLEVEDLEEYREINKNIKLCAKPGLQEE
ncbi:hypothetical protein RCC89_07905 [Cytophagaceae bacterium ABcell3]|nr:hypothetical protein RCC89_07905 [Cytophagaceae bacterium ABcell3]